MKSSIWALTKRVEGLSRRRTEAPSPEVIRAVSDWTIQQAEPRSGKVVSRDEWETMNIKARVDSFVRGDRLEGLDA